MVDYKKYIILLKNNCCCDCMFKNHRNGDPAYIKYLDKGFTSCLSSVACFCETELKMTEEQINKYIFKGIELCYRDLVTSRIIDFIKKTKLEKIAKLEIE